MRDTVGKEIRRTDLEFGNQLGQGEFGAVYEGFFLIPVPKQKVAIKMLRQSKGTTATHAHAQILSLSLILLIDAHI